MFWLGLFLPIVFVPGWTGASISTQWPLLSAILPLMMLRRRCRLGTAHLLGILFVSYAALSLMWTVDFNDSIMGLWIAAMWALAFWLGSTEESLEGLWKGLAIGMTISSAVAVSQYLGYRPVLTFGNGNTPSGLLFNTIVSGSAASLVVIGLISHRLWFYIPGVLVSMILANSRGAWLMLALAMIARYLHWKVAVGILAAAALIFTYQAGYREDDGLRLTIWRVAYDNLSWLGLGPGTFVNVLVSFAGKIHRPEFTHNDYLQLWFEFGLGAIPLYCIVAWSLTRTSSQDWPVLVAFAVLGLFWFPLYSPIPAFIGCVVAGHLVRDRHVLRGDGVRGRPDVVSGHPELRPAPV